VEQEQKPTFVVLHTTNEEGNVKTSVLLATKSEQEADDKADRVVSALYANEEGWACTEDGWWFDFNSGYGAKVEVVKSEEG